MTESSLNLHTMPIMPIAWPSVLRSNRRIDRDGHRKKSAIFPTNESASLSVWMGRIQSMFSVITIGRK